MWKSLTNLWRGLLDLIVPPACWMCHTRTGDDGALCPSCLHLLTEDDEPVCPRCASTLAPAAATANICPRCLTAPAAAYDAVVRLGPYDDAHREFVVRCKRSAGEALAEALAPILSRPLSNKVRPFAPDFAIPVPLHWLRRWQRGYNQSEVIGKSLAEELKVPLLTKALKRVRYTPIQARRTAKERRANVRGAFGATADLDLTGKVVVLVDDVLTTGATANEAAKVLKKCGAKSVIVAVLAHESPGKTGQLPTTKVNAS